MRLTDGGILALGTTVVTGAAAGEFVVANASVHQSVNAAGTGMVPMINVNSSNQVVLNPGGVQDIRWGVALIGLGGGAAPTLGTIGGTGPTIAGQNSWMRVIDTAGEAFWLPAWK